jgi:threonine synthase
MDIQVASNFERLLFYVLDQNEKKVNQLMSNLKNKGSFNLDSADVEKIKKDFVAQSVSDDEVLKIIKNFYQEFNILIDPHTAVGVGAIEKQNIKGKNIVLSTADPSKFRNAVKKATNKTPDLPEKLNYIIKESEQYQKLPTNLEKIKKYILSKI